jgi:hypothetical protein
MDDFLTGVIIGLWVMGACTGLFSIVAVPYALARFNVVWTIVQEGQVKTILKLGQFHRNIMSYKGHDFDQDWNVIDSLPHRRLFGGFQFVGIPIIHTVHTYKFSWMSYQQVQKDGGIIYQAIPHKDELLDYILVQDDVYFSFIDKAETIGMVPVDVSLLLTIRILNPYKALFRVQNWLEVTLNQVVPALRAFIGTKEFEQLTSGETRKQVEQKFNEFLRFSHIDEFLRENYGVDLRKADMAAIDPGGNRGIAYVEAASKKWEAEKEKEKILTIADAQVERVNRVYGAIKRHGDAGLFIRAAEAAEEVGKGAGNTVLFPLGPIKDLIEAWTRRGGNLR